MELMMTTVDLGFPILLTILVFWGLFALSAILTTFTKRENLRDIKDFLHRMSDTSNKHQSGKI